MQLFIHHTLFIAFKRLNDPNTTDIELALSVKTIVARSNIVITCNGILCGMIYQQNYPGLLDKASKVLVTISLLIVTWNRLQYESHFINALRMQVQQTGSLFPTLRYVVPEVLLGVLLILEGFKAGGAGGATIVTLLFAILLCLGWVSKQEGGKSTEMEVIDNAARVA